MFIENFTKDNWDNWMIKSGREKTDVNKFVLSLCPDQSYNDFVYNIVCEAIDCYEKQNLTSFYRRVDYYNGQTSDCDIENLLTHFQDHYKTFEAYELKGLLDGVADTITKISLFRRLQIDNLLDLTIAFLDDINSNTLKLYEIDTISNSFKIFAKNKVELKELFSKAWAKQLTADFTEDSQDYVDQLIQDANAFMVEHGVIYRDDCIVIRGDNVC